MESGLGGALSELSGLSCETTFEGRALRLAPPSPEAPQPSASYMPVADNIPSYNITSGDENHLCGASLRKGHKISLKAHRVCMHTWGWYPNS